MVPLNPKQMLIDALRFENRGLILEAFRNYDEAIDSIGGMLKMMSAERKMYYKPKVDALKNYHKHLEERILPKNQVVQSTIIRIRNGDTGNSYEKLFGKYLDDTVREVHIYEGFIITQQQIKNLMSFLELLKLKCRNLKYICVFTKKHFSKTENRITKEDYKKRKDAFQQLIKDFRAINITFRYRFKIKAHDRLIMLGNGTNIFSGYGLDFYQTPENFYVGFVNYEMRKCKDTFINITQLPPEKRNNFLI